MCNINYSLVNSIRKRFSSYNKQELAVVFASATIFMPFVITCIMLIGVCIFALSDKKTRHKMIYDKTNIPIYVFSVLLIVVPLLYGRYISACAGVGYILGMIFFIFAKSIITKNLYNDIMDVCCASSVICFIYAVVQKLIMGITFRATGGLLNANYYGAICEIVIIIAVYKLISNQRYKGFYITILVMNVIGICLCDCQSAWISVMVGIIGLLFLSGYKKQGFIVLAISLVLIIAGVFVPGLLPRMKVMPQTFSTRKNIWMTAIKGIKAHFLFGQGTLTYLFTYKLYNGYKTYHAHSLYLDPLLSYGIVGVLVMLYYFYGVLKNILNNLKQGFNKKIMSLVLGVTFAVCIHGITDVTVLWVQTGMLVFIVLSGAFVKRQNNG